MTAPAQSLSFRPVTLDDADTLRHDLWPERTPRATTEFLERCANQMRIGRARAVVAEVEGQIVGFALLTFWRDLGEIGDLIVAPDVRGQGIGSALIAHLMESARQHGTTRMEIGAAASNPRALSLYQRLGFSIHGSVELDLGDGLEKVVYLSQSLS